MELSRALTNPTSRHPGLEPGSIVLTLQRLRNGSRLKAGMTIEFTSTSCDAVGRR